MSVIRASNAGTGTVLQYLGLILIVVWVCLSHRRWPRASELIAMILALIGTFLLSTHGTPGTLALTPVTLAWGGVAALTLATYTLLPASLIAAYGAELVVGYGLTIAGAGVGLVGRVWRSRSRGRPTHPCHDNHRRAGHRRRLHRPTCGASTASDPCAPASSAAPNPSRRPCSPPSSWEAPTRVPTSSARPSSSVPL